MHESKDYLNNLLSVCQCQLSLQVLQNLLLFPLVRVGAIGGREGRVVGHVFVSHVLLGIPNPQ